MSTVTGWRAFALAGQRLCSPVTNDTWISGTAVAQCDLGHEPPHPSHHCGLHACLELAELRTWIRYMESVGNVEQDPRQCWAFARVELDEPLLDPVTRPPGIPFSDPPTTVRSRRLVITHIWLPPTSRAISWAPILEKRYACPVVVSSDWDEATPGDPRTHGDEFVPDPVPHEPDCDPAGRLQTEVLSNRGGDAVAYFQCHACDATSPTLTLETA
jgi:hypothetical protein